MEKVNRPEPRHGAHNITLLIYHMQLTIKYRGDIIVGPLIGLLKAVIRQAGSRHGIRILRIGTDINHIHIFFQKIPNMSIARVANYLKGISSRLVRINLPCLKIWCRGSFWSDGYWCQTVGYGWYAIDRYIKNQGIKAC